MDFLWYDKLASSSLLHCKHGTHTCEAQIKNREGHYRLLTSEIRTSMQQRKHLIDWGDSREHSETLSLPGGMHRYSICLIQRYIHHLKPHTVVWRARSFNFNPNMAHSPQLFSQNLWSCILGLLQRDYLWRALPQLLLPS